ncbi:hypothetical protein QJQ45_012564 [Haematococcus lacustris]|nr:hypothetical protein QJQ45_012564 [Haematococcus lacustris]
MASCVRAVDSTLAPAVPSAGHLAPPPAPGSTASTSLAASLTKLTRSQVQHDSGLIQARRNTQRWIDNVKLELQHLAAATPADTPWWPSSGMWPSPWPPGMQCGGILEYLHPKWAEQKMRLYGAQEKVLERYFKKLEEEAAIESQKRWGTRKQLVVFFDNAGISTRGLPQGGGEGQQRQANRVPGKVVTGDEFRTSRREEEVAGGVRDGRGADAALRACFKVVLAQGAALNMQHTVDNKWCPLQLCWWPDLPAKGKEYPDLGHRRLRDRLLMPSSNSSLWPSVVCGALVKNSCSASALHLLPTEFMREVLLSRTPPAAAAQRFKAAQQVCPVHHTIIESFDTQPQKHCISNIGYTNTDK